MTAKGRQTPDPPDEHSRELDWETFLRCARGALLFLASQPSFARQVFVEARHSPHPEMRRLYAAGTEALVAELDRMWLRETGGGPQPPSATRAALGGVEAIVRRELVAGRAGRLPDLLPDIVYGLSAPFLDQDEALRRTKLAGEQLKGDPPSLGPPSGCP